MSNNTLVKGQRLKMGSSNKINISHKYLNDRDFDADLFAVLVDKNGLAKLNEIIFYNKAISKDESIEYREFEKTGQQYKSIVLEFDTIDKSIEKIVLGIEFYRSVSVSKEFHERDYRFEIIGSDGISIVGEYIGKINTNNQSLLLGEVYLYKGEWKFRTILQKSKENIKKTIEKEQKARYI